MRTRLNRGLQRIVRRVRGAGPVILMYHRIARPALDPWDLAVSPERFDEHVATLKAHRVVLPMSEFGELFEKGRLPRKAVGITFDDGYVDNLLNAAPILEQRSATATLFLATGGVGQRRPYWWDELAELILLRRAALDLPLDLDGQGVRVTLPAAEGPPQAWRACDGPRTPREHTFLDLWAKLRDLDLEARERSMAQLRTTAETPSAPGDLPMRPAEVRALARSGAFEIGGHTINHPRLSELDAEGQRTEIAAGKRACEALTGAPITGFAYPYGDFDDRARAAVREAGFRWACTTRSGPVRHKDDIYALPRLAAMDWPADALKAALEAV